MKKKLTRKLWAMIEIMTTQLLIYSILLISNTKDCILSKWILSKFATKKWYVVDSKSKSGYSHGNPIKFLTKSIESGLCDYSDAYILVTGDIVVKRRNTAVTADIALGAITQVAFKIYPPFKDCRTEINDNSIDFADLTKIKRRI